MSQDPQPDEPQDEHGAYLAPLPADQRAALEALTARVEARLGPEAERCMSYGMPAWRVPTGPAPDAKTAVGKGGKGGRKRKQATKVIGGFGAFKTHLGYYPFSGSVVPQIADKLAEAGFKTSKSGVIFTPASPLPDWALDTLIALRRAEIG